MLDPYVFLLSFLREAIGGRENEINFAYFVIFYIVITTHKEILPGGMFSQKHRLSFVFTDVKGPSSFMKKLLETTFLQGDAGNCFQKAAHQCGSSFQNNPLNLFQPAPVESVILRSNYQQVHG